MDVDDRRIERLELLERRYLLEQLVQTYAVTIDARDFSTLRELFCPEAVVRTLRPGGRTTTGADQIADGMARRFENYDRTFHVVHGLVVERCDSSSASGVTTGHAEVVRDGVPMITGMRYRDEFCLHDGRWRFATRTHSYFYFLRARDYDDALGSSEPVRSTDEWLPSDW